MFEDIKSGRSFTLNAHPDANQIASLQFSYNMIRTQNGFTGPYDVCAIVGGKPVEPRLPHRFELGDDVLVAVGPESMHPQYDDGWKRGVVVETNVDGKLPGCSYRVKLLDGSVVPAHRDDPDFVREDPDFVREVYTPGNPTPKRFQVGTEVECRVGPMEWQRGTIRVVNAEFPGFGRGWTEDGRPHPKHHGPKDRMA